MARRLVRTQHPDLAHLPVRPLGSGWDTEVHLLGSELVVRLPRRPLGAQLLAKELAWVPRLPDLPLPSPRPIRAGEPRNRAGVGAYDGRALVGRILHTWLHGVTVFDAQTGGPGHAPSLRRTPKGRLLSAS